MTGKTKTLLSLLVLSLFAFSLSACGSAEKNAMDTTTNGEEQMMKISDQLMNGEITNEEADKMMEKIQKNMKSANDKLKDTYANVSAFHGLPKWAKGLGIYEPKGFDMIDSKTSVTKYNEHDGMGEGIILVYAYDDEAKAIQAAEKLAANIWIAETNNSPRILQKSLDKTMESVMGSMSDKDKADYEKNKMSGYIADGNKGDYSIMISVLQGELSIIATNVAQAGN